MPVIEYKYAPTDSFIPSPFIVIGSKEIIVIIELNNIVVIILIFTFIDLKSITIVKPPRTVFNKVKIKFFIIPLLFFINIFNVLLNPLKFLAYFLNTNLLIISRPCSDNKNISISIPINIKANICDISLVPKYRHAAIKAIVVSNINVISMFRKTMADILPVFNFSLFKKYTIARSLSFPIDISPSAQPKNW